MERKCADANKNEKKNETKRSSIYVSKCKLESLLTNTHRLALCVALKVSSTHWWYIGNRMWVIPGKLNYRLELADVDSLLSLVLSLESLVIKQCDDYRNIYRHKFQEALCFWESFNSFECVCVCVRVKYLPNDVCPWFTGERIMTLG